MYDSLQLRPVDWEVIDAVFDCAAVSNACDFSAIVWV